MHPLDQGREGMDSTSGSATVLLSGPAWPVSVCKMEINLTVGEIVNVRRERRDVWCPGHVGCQAMLVSFLVSFLSS